MATQRTERAERALALLDGMLSDVEVFNRQILGVPIPDSPQPIGEGRGLFRLKHMREELGEMEETFVAPQPTRDAQAAEQADALIDLIYIALGTLLEMGVTPGPAFAAVHAANMKKQRGELAKRPGAMGHDAIKPEGWSPPDMVEAILTVTPAVAAALSPAFVEAAHIRATKGQDYNASVKLADYFPLGQASYFQMIHVKVLRLRNLISTGKLPNHESMRDTLVDLCNYSSYWVEAIDRREV